MHSFIKDIFYQGAGKLIIYQIELNVNIFKMLLCTLFNISYMKLSITYNAYIQQYENIRNHKLHALETYS